MAFRFLRLGTVYPEFGAQVMRAAGGAKGRSYAELYELFRAERFAESDFHAVHMRRLGNAAENYFISIEALQKQWAAEHGVGYRESEWMTDIALAQAYAFRPDVIYLDDLYAVDAGFRRRLREVAKPAPRIIGWRAAPTENYAQFRDLDLMLTSIAGMAEDFRRHGVNADVLHHSFEASTLDAVTPGERDIPVSFAGGLGNLHPERIAMVETLLRRTPMQVWGAQGDVRLKDRVRSWLAIAGIPQKHKSRGRTLPLRYPGRVHEPVFGRDYYGVLGRSKIVVNRHVGCAGDWASNMRMFEATGMGACLVTDNKRNLGELFKPGVECVTYDGLDDCVDKITYLLRHDAEREAIAAAGQRRTLHDHRFEQRVAAMAERIERLFPQRQAA